MELIRIATMAEGAQPLYERLSQELTAGEQVLWLVTGGSSIQLSAQVMLRLPDELTSQLTILLTDERYGEVGHADSNASQLLAAGFTAKNAAVLPVLRPGFSLEKTVDGYSAALSTAFAAATVVIGQFGMGEDGHIAGILPGSPAVPAVAVEALAVGYEAKDFTRITMTPAAFQHVDVAYVYAFGDAKREALQNLSRELPVTKQPAQVLKSLPEAYIYNDQIGDIT